LRDGRYAASRAKENADAFAHSEFLLPFGPKKLKGTVAMGVSTFVTPFFWPGLA
jgi:hypothetical protein